MSDLRSTSMEHTLSRAHLHQKWISEYYSVKNEEFYEGAFDYITQFFIDPKNSVLLDAGCGSGVHSIRLAKRGYRVTAVDFSANVLKMAEKNIKASCLSDRITLQRENMLSLTFDDDTFDYILCWGVLMHIPDLEKALSEIIRVLKPGGIVVISEGNMFSFQSVILRIFMRLKRKKLSAVKQFPAGLEFWTTTSSGKLLIRHFNILWLINKFKNNGFILRNHIAGQFTESFVKFQLPLLKNISYGINKFWFKYIRIPQLSWGNIIILQKHRS